MPPKAAGNRIWDNGYGNFGPLRPSPAHPGFPLRDRMVVRLRGGMREHERLPIARHAAEVRLEVWDLRFQIRKTQSFFI
jgi:hypothetical protein